MYSAEDLLSRLKDNVNNFIAYQDGLTFLLMTFPIIYFCESIGKFQYSHVVNYKSCVIEVWNKGKCWTLQIHPIVGGFKYSNPDLGFFTDLKAMEYELKRLL